MAQPIKAIPTLYGEEARRFQSWGICNPPTLFLCFIYYPFPLSPPIPFRDDKLPSHPHR